MIPFRKRPMRIAASVFVLAVLLAGGAYVIHRPGIEERHDSPASPAATVPPPQPVETAAVVPTVEEEKPHHERVRHVFRGSVLAAKTLQPVEGARVALLGPDSRAPALAESVTRSDGAFAIEAEGYPRVSAVEVRKTGFLPARWETHGESEESYNFQLERGRAVKGRVRLRDGTPVGSGEVFVLETHDIPSTGVPFPLPFRIASDGTFIAAAAGEAIAVLAIGHAFRPSVSGPIELRPGEGVETVIDVERGRSVSGIVQDGDGRPIARASIEGTLSCPDLEKLCELEGFALPDTSKPVTFTDAAGRFTLGVFGAEPAEVRVWAEGYQPENAEETDGAFRITLDPRLAEPTRLTRRMTVGIQGLPPGVRLPPRAYLGKKQGRHDVMQLEGARYTVASFWTDADKGWVQVPGFERIPVEWPEGTEDHDLGEIELQRGRTLEISVVDGKGRGVPTVSVLLEPHSSWCGTYVGLTDVPFETDAKGFVLVGGLWSQGHQLRFAKVGFITKDTWVETQEPVSKVTVLLEEEAIVTGRAIRPHGEPLSRAAVGFRFDEHNRSGDTTDWTGAFLVRVPAGRDLRGVLAAKNAAPTPFTVTALAPGERRDLGDIQPHPGETLRGTAIGEDGRPLALQSLSMAPVIDDEEVPELVGFLAGGIETETDGEGRFEFRGLLPGRYTVQAFLVEEERSQERSVTVPFSGTFVFALDDPELQMYSGVVRDADGSPVQGARVSLWTRESRDGNFSENVATDAQGTFKFRGLPQDLFLPVLRVEHGLLSDSFLADSVPQLPRELVLERASAIRIQVDLESPSAHEKCCALRLVDSEGRSGGLECGADGMIRSDRVPPGTFRGVVTAPGHLPANIDIQTRIGQVFTATVVLQKLPPRSKRAFLVKDSDGNPLRHVSINVDTPRDHARTEEDGTAELDLVTQVDCGVTVHKEGYYPVRLQPADFGGKKAVEVVLRPNGAIDARVSIPGDARDLDYSLRVEPLEVPRWDASKWSGGCTIEGPDDCTFNDLPAGRYALLVMSASGSKPWILAREEVTVIDGANTDVPLELPAHFQVRGVVTSAGKPLARNPIVLSTSRDGREYRLRSNLDDAGRFSRSACVPGTYTVSVGVGGALRRVATVEITGEIDLALELEP